MVQSPDQPGNQQTSPPPGSGSTAPPRPVQPPAARKKGLPLWFWLLLVPLVLLPLVVVLSVLGGPDGPPAIRSAEMGRGFENDRIVNPTTVFSPKDEAINCVAILDNVTSTTKVKVVWTAIEVAGEAEGNIILGEREIVLSNRQNVVNFYLTAQREWPAGKYKADLFLNDKLARTLEFTVQ